MKPEERVNPLTLLQLRDRVVSRWRALGEPASEPTLHEPLAAALICAVAEVLPELAEIVVHQRLCVWADTTPFCGIGLPGRPAFLGLERVSEAMGKYLATNEVRVTSVFDSIESKIARALPAAEGLH